VVSMKAKEVLNLLHISRATLTNYTKSGLIKHTVLHNGRYDYDKDSVYKLFNGNLLRKTCIYTRVSTSKQKSDLENQIGLLKQFCFSNGWTISNIFSDVASGISFEKRKNFFELLDMIISGQVEKVVITYKDRLSRVGFDLFSHLFRKYNTEIVVMSEVGNEKLDKEEIFEEIISLLHCFSMKMYSRRKKNKIKKLLEEGDSFDKSNKTSDQEE